VSSHGGSAGWRRPSAVARAALPRLRWLDWPSLRAMWWAGRELRALRRVLPERGLHAAAGAPPALPASAVRGVRALAWMGRANCLERSLILQSWYAARGRRLDIVVGVDSSEDGFRAHAWVPEIDGPQPEYTVLTRKPAP
jgi:hypothetical protein